jgi:hypothetical protein
MAKWSMEVPHGLSQDEAARRLRARFAEAVAEHDGQVRDLRQEWVDHTYSFAFRAMGMAISGTVAVEPNRVRLAAELPLAAMFFRGAIESRLRREMDDLMASRGGTSDERRESPSRPDDQ